VIFNEPKPDGINMNLLRKTYFLPLIFLCTPLHAQWIEDPAIQQLVTKGIQATYNVNFAEADRSFQAVKTARPDHPAGYFFLAMVDWWRILLAGDDESRDDAFLDKLDHVIDMCDERLDRNERDITALFFKGGAIGFRGRLRATRKSWFKTAADGKAALPIVIDAAKLGGKNPDIDLGTGIYNYYAAVLPSQYPVLKPLMFFLPKGNREKGIRQLKNAADNARYANYEAAYFLVMAYTSYENKPSLALPYAKRLHETFPANPVFHRTLGKTYVRLGDWTNAAKQFRGIMDNSKSNMFGYSKPVQREALYYLGNDALNRRDFPGALAYFSQCDALNAVLDKEESSGFQPMCCLRLGQVHDAMKNRSMALKQYSKALSMKDFGGAHDLARKYKSAPYAP
jgi:tetratricopeptide (TPR) repeat protein